MLGRLLKFGVTCQAALLSLIFATMDGVGAHAAAPSLPTYNADVTQTSISGISAGAFMAVQFATAWSSIISGVGAIAGGPFGCSEGSASEALSTCMGGLPTIDLQALIERTDAWSNSGAIDNTVLLSNEKIYLFNGYNDNVVARAVSNALYGFYAHYLPSMGNVFYQTAIGAGHSQVTLDYGGACNENGGEFINRCGYDQAGVILQHIYGALNPRQGGALTGTLLPFSQGEFTTPLQPVDDSLDNTGYVYVPSACGAQQPCRLHIVLHGCLQSFSNLGQDFIKHAGYNEWADTNHIIVLYPQTQSLALTNPQACWDWWGYLDRDPTASPAYLLKSGKQIGVIKAMLDRVTGGESGPPNPAVSPSDAPAKIISADRTDRAIDIVWSSVPGVMKYDVFRASLGNANFEKIATVAGSSYADDRLSPATKYQYKVRVSSAAGTAPFSKVVIQTTLRRVPQCDDPGTCAVH